MSESQVKAIVERTIGLEEIKDIKGVDESDGGVTPKILPKTHLLP